MKCSFTSTTLDSMAFEVPKLHVESYGKGAEEPGVENGEGGRQWLFLSQFCALRRGRL